MKKFLPIFVALLASMAVLKSQTLDCNGVRYLQNVFTTGAKTTVTFGSNINSGGTTTTLKMDIYQPVGDVLPNRPLIILAHGGSFITGARSDMASICDSFCKKGYVAATIDYRLWSFFWGLPDSLSIMDVVVKSVGDFKCAIRYFREDAAGPNLYKIDPNRIIIGGYSAGAVAAMHTAQMGPDDQIPTFVMDRITANGGFEGTTGSASNLAQSSDVRAVVSLSGGLYKKEWIDADDKPFCSFHGEVDDVVPFHFGIAAGIMSLNGSGNLHPIADATTVKNYLKSVPDGDHMNIHFDASQAANRADFYKTTFQFLEDNVLCPVVSTNEAAPDFVEKTTLSISPNLAFEETTVRFPNNSTGWTVDVFDVVGRRVASFKNQSNSLVVNKLDVGGRAGLFVFRASSASGEQRVGRVIFE